ncbi:hypothetical protein B0H67DRAFT_254542 [Lasiosphaeris hirsuta]|uniref:AAA+ ATPase domain-containing protein n=1 Tax=Lasiosphaeris hirsuta TaxID=260670 RepID=A0AA40AHI4_9PEZI|nr:hypothetical protein B0H67DRAFT_254542 [Lasiosphaeris hirsuta]
MPTSSPIAFPASSPIGSKRQRTHDSPIAPKSKKLRVLGGFLADDDSDDDDDNDVTNEPLPKRCMLDSDMQDAQPRSVEYDEPINEILDESLPDAQEAITTPSDSLLYDPEEAERYERLFSTQVLSLPSLSSTAQDDLLEPPAYRLSTCAGRSVPIRERKTVETVPYATMVAARSKTKEGRAHKAFFGIDIHELIDSANKEITAARKVTAATPPTPPSNPDNPVASIEGQPAKRHKKTMLWTEKYRARTFMDLVGDDLTNRQVLRWLKRWDPIVFPHGTKSKPSLRRHGQQSQQPEEERPHRKILMLTGPPGLGKTTLAHVCARQAGYEVLEINASDDRSKDVVKGRIRTSLGTESVKNVGNKKPEAGKQQKIARPVCVVVDEVDGAAGGSGASGEGGFVRALIDLVLLDQKNNSGAASFSGAAGKRKKKGDDFRQMRPLILICNDVYHPSLRPLRQSGHAEVIHVGKPSVEAVVTRLKAVFEKEGIPCEKDAARKLCEAAWGMSSGIDAKKGLESNAEGDLRGVMVVGEWVAGRLKATSNGTPSLTRQWVDKNILQDLAHGGGGARGLGRGGTKEIVTRIFQEGAGFPKQAASASTTAQSRKTKHEQPQAQMGFSEQQKKYAMGRLREMIDTSGEVDRIMTEIFLEYPNRDFNDDSFLTKPDEAYEWLHFHDTCSSRMWSSQDWELTPYISQPILACHHLFASPRRHQPQTTNGYGRKWGDTADDEIAAAPVPFSGPRADYQAYEALKVNRATLQAIQGQLPPSLSRAFRSPEDVATDFLPYLVRLVAPDVKPVVIGGSDKFGSVASVRREGEKAMVRRAAQVLAEVGIALHKGKIEADVAAGPVNRVQWVYRMDPDIESLATYETAGAFVLAVQAPTRYAVRQVLDQELIKTIAQREGAARQARLRAGGFSGTGTRPQGEYVFDDKENAGSAAAGKSAIEKMKALMVETSVKKDFFGRIIVEKSAGALGEADGNGGARKSKENEKGRVWVTYHEGLNNAVRKPISLEEFLGGL